jgi:hypothetical protein
MKCVVVTDWNVWDFQTISEARKQYKFLVDYCLKYGNNDGPHGVTPSEFVEIWPSSVYYDEDGSGRPIEEFYNDAEGRAKELKKRKAKKR